MNRLDIEYLFHAMTRVTRLERDGSDRQFAQQIAVAACNLSFRPNDQQIARMVAVESRFYAGERQA